jgi:hypothetical protein
MFTSQSLSLAAGIAGFSPAPHSYEFQKSKRFGFLYYQITKCGCTYTKALINHLDGRAEAADPIRVNWQEGDQTAFVIVRNPIDRFLSFYFDKVIGPPCHISRKFERLNLINPKPMTIQDHQHNCLQVLGWINSTLNGGSQDKVNFHWRPQIFRLHKISNLRVRMLTLDAMNWQLPLVLSDSCSKITKAMGQVGPRNVSAKPIQAGQILDQKIRKQISRIYAADERVYSEVTRNWAQETTGHTDYGQDIKQTARGWLVADRQARRNHIQRGSEQSKMGA